jgi:hypothetical protein
MCSRTVPRLNYQFFTSHNCNSQLKFKKIEVVLRPTVSRPICLVFKPPYRPKTRFLLLSGSCGFVDVGRPLWRQDGSVVYKCCWPSPAQSFSGPNTAGLITIWVFCCLRLEPPQIWRPGPRIYIPQEQGSPVAPPTIWFTFFRPLQLNY